MAEVNPNINKSETNPDVDPKIQPDDAERLAEGAKLDKIKVPGVNVESDYKASKKYSVSSADRSDLGAEEAEAATAPQADITGARATNLEAEANLSKGEKGDPDEFRSIAKEVDPKSPKPASQ